VLPVEAPVDVLLPPEALLFDAPDEAEVVVAVPSPLNLSAPAVIVIGYIDWVTLAASKLDMVVPGKFA
jgi:hypothetical protein